MTRPRAAASRAGFTLIETLVALAILGIVLTTVYGVFGSGLRAAHRDEDRLLLALVAQNLMARSRLDLFPAEGALTGDIGGGLRWRIEGEPYVLPEGLLPEVQEREPDEGGALAGDGPARAEGDRGRSGMGEETSRRGAFGDGGRTAGDDGDGDGAGFGRVGGDRRGAADREPVRLRLVRITVEKGAERFDLAGLVQEPRVDRDRLP